MTAPPIHLAGGPVDYTRSSDYGASLPGLPFVLDLSRRATIRLHITLSLYVSIPSSAPATWSVNMTAVLFAPAFLDNDFAVTVQNRDHQTAVADYDRTYGDFILEPGSYTFDFGVTAYQRAPGSGSNDAGGTTIVTSYLLDLEAIESGGHIAPRRVHPRDDMFGFGAPRTWPPPISVSASNRRGPGSYL